MPWDAPSPSRETGRKLAGDPQGTSVGAPSPPRMVPVAGRVYWAVPVLILSLLELSASLWARS